jgi:uncharacterized membrane protein HdeD (DUF308 family)
LNPAIPVLLIMFGFLAIMSPIATSLGVVLVVAWLLMISGVVQFVHAFRCVGNRLQDDAQRQTSFPGGVLD